MEDAVARTVFKIRIPFLANSPRVKKQNFDPIKYINFPDIICLVLISILARYFVFSEWTIFPPYPSLPPSLLGHSIFVVVSDSTTQIRNPGHLVSFNGGSQLVFVNRLPNWFSSALVNADSNSQFYYVPPVITSIPTDYLLSKTSGGKVPTRELLFKEVKKSHLEIVDIAANSKQRIEILFQAKANTEQSLYAYARSTENHNEFIYKVGYNLTAALHGRQCVSMCTDTNERLMACGPTPSLSYLDYLFPAKSLLLSIEGTGAETRSKIETVEPAVDAILRPVDIVYATMSTLCTVEKSAPHNETCIRILDNTWFDSVVALSRPSAKKSEGLVFALVQKYGNFRKQFCLMLATVFPDVTSHYVCHLEWSIVAFDVESKSFATVFQHDGSLYTGADDLQVLDAGNKFAISSSYFGKGLALVTLNSNK